MAIRNVKEGLGNFLATIGDIQRQHEIYQMENQREADRKTALKSQLETEAMNRTLAGNRDIREAGSYQFERSLDPSKLEAAGLEPERIRSATRSTDANTRQSDAGTSLTNIQREVFGRDNAPGGIIEQERRAGIAERNAATGAHGASAATARAQAARLQRDADNEMYLQYTPYDDKYSMWDAIQAGERGLPGVIDKQSGDILEKLFSSARGDATALAEIMAMPAVQALLPEAMKKAIIGTGGAAPAKGKTTPGKAF